MSFEAKYFGLKDKTNWNNYVLLFVKNKLIKIITNCSFVSISKQFCHILGVVQNGGHYI